MTDLHPDYYNDSNRQECWDEFITRFGPTETYVWCLLTAEKYLYRAGKKNENTKERDIQKAKNYLDKATEIRQQYFKNKTFYDFYAMQLYVTVKEDIKQYEIG